MNMRMSVALVLTELSYGESYVAPLVERLRAKVGHWVGSGSGLVYPILAEAEKAGYVKSRFARTAGQKGGLPKRIFRLTKAGSALAKRAKKEFGQVFAP